MKSCLPEPELERRFLYSVAVAGKSASMIDAALPRLLAGCVSGESPFQLIRRLNKVGGLDEALRSARLGNYGRLARSYTQATAAKLDLANCTQAQLEKIHGIGPKTARFFILWTRPLARCAALDTHVLKWLRFIGVDAPDATPTSPKLYAKLEAVFLSEADARGVLPRDLDAKIWDWCSGRNHLTGQWPAELQPRVEGAA